LETKLFGENTKLFGENTKLFGEDKIEIQIENSFTPISKSIWQQKTIGCLLV